MISYKAFSTRRGQAQYSQLSSKIVDSEFLWNDAMVLMIGSKRLLQRATARPGPSNREAAVGKALSCWATEGCLIKIMMLAALALEQSSPNTPGRFIYVFDVYGLQRGFACGNRFNVSSIEKVTVALTPRLAFIIINPSGISG